MEISEVRINLNKGGKVKAFAQVIFDGCFLVGDIRVLEGKEGTVYVAMPSRRLRNGSFRDIAHPLNTDTRKHLDEAILSEYERVVAERGVTGDGGVASTRSQQIANRLLGDKYWTNEEGEEE
jgi:stage V sporulation protein G